MKHLIINADDYGYCRERNRGMIESIAKKSVSSVSLLVNGVASGEVGLLKELNPLSVGLHFNITEGKPTCSTNTIPSLLNEENLFKGKFGLREAVKQNNVNIDEVEKELRSQIASFKKLTGRLPTHVDGHHHIHILPGICDIFGSVLAQEGIKWTRVPTEENVESCDWIDEERKHFYTEVSCMARNAGIAFSAKGIMFPQHFIGMRFMGKNMTVKRLSEAVENAFHMCNKTATICELMAHPGYVSKPGEGGCGDVLDSFSMSTERKHEMDVLNSKEWKEFLSNQNITVLPYPS